MLLLAVNIGLYQSPVLRLFVSLETVLQSSLKVTHFTMIFYSFVDLVLVLLTLPYTSLIIKLTTKYQNIVDPMDDAKPGGGVPGPEDEEEYVEFPDGPPAKPKQEPQDESAPAEVQSCDAGELGHGPTPNSDKFL